MKPNIPSISGGDSQGEGGSSGVTITDAQWKEWNDYMYTLTDAKEKETKPGKFLKAKSAVGILNFIADVGYQPQEDGEYDSKVATPTGDEENSPEELEVIKKYPTNYFLWVVDDKGNRKRKQYSPQRPEQEYAFFYDFPEIVIDWTKHPNPDMHKLGTKPLRVSYNGRFKRGDMQVFARTLPFRIDYKTKTLSTKNPIYKIAEASGVAEAFVSSGYDLGELAQSACKWTIEFNRNVVGDKVFYNTNIKSPTAIEDVSAGGMTITRAQQTPACDITFVGVHFNGDEYNQEDLDYIKNRRELIEVLKRAKSFKPSPVSYPDFVLGCDFANSKLAAALGMAGTQDSSVSPGQTPPAEDTPDDNDQDGFIVGANNGFDDTIPF
jgi:hypothetical protein